MAALTAKSHPEGLEDVADDIEVSCSEDEDDGGREGDGGSTGVLPLSDVSSKQ
jgi:hypothetical protein